MPFILSAEIESIQKYIVTSNKMWTIRAGSYILDKFNKEIEKEFKSKAISNGRLIYSSAGSVKAIFEDKDFAARFGKDIAKRLKRETEIASLTWAVEEIKNNNISSALKKVEKTIQEKRGKKETPVSIISHPLFYDCEICKDHPATSEIEKVKKYLVCHSCKLKFDGESKFLPIYNELNQVRNETRKLFEDFDKLVKDDYLALICSDGNRLGEHLIGLSDKPNPEGLLKKFSERLNKATNDTFKETVNVVFEDFFKKEKEHFPFMVIVLGGDDMSVAMPAKYAFEFTKIFTEKFAQKTKNFGDGLPEVSISTGIAIAKHTFPFSNLYELAEELLSNAKKLSRWLREKNDSKEYSTIDFEIITQSLSEEVSERRSSLLFKNYFATGRPYLIGSGNYPFKFENLYETVKRLKKAEVSNSFINSLYEIVKTPTTMKIELEIKLNRLYNKQREIKGLLDNYKTEKPNFEGKSSLPILDIAEVYNYLGD
jgi:CRISPR/Cas system-associated protein Cas10 (large subunit of type III CRISPR-Cas system)